MIKKLVLFSCLFICVAAQAQRQVAEAYINQYKELAISEMLRTGVPAAIKLAQGILESQSGESELAKKSNNHFGIKCKTEWTGAKTYHDDDEKGECFRVYPSVEDSYKDHSDFLRTRPHYAFLFQLDPADYEGWAKGLKKAGYATSPTYPQKLLKVISDYNLQQYSLLALERKRNGTGSNSVVSVITNPPATATQTSESRVNTAPRVEDPKEETVVTENTTNTTTVEPVNKIVTYPQGIFTINHSKVIYGTEGTSLLSLANQFDIPLSKLLEYNDLPEMDILDTDRLIFIERKLKKGATDFHLVQQGETLHAISQQEGVRLESILEYNHLAKGATVSAGEKIYLHSLSATVTQPTRLPK